MADNYTNNNYIQAPLEHPFLGSCMQQQHHHVAGGYNRSGEDGLNQTSHVPSMAPRSVNGCLPVDFSNPHIGVNYTHLPYSSGITSSVMTTLSSVASVSGGLSVTAPGSFTFTSPTRHSNVCSASSLTSLNHHYGHFTQASSARQTFAPGLGAAWQHSIPSQMPWTESGSTAVPPTFTGSMGYNYTYSAGLNEWSTSLEPIPSCSTPPRRPKRTAVSDGCEIPNKLHISEEKMTVSMQELSLSHDSYDDEMEDNLPTSTEKSIEKSWKKFKELEQMLSCDKSTVSPSSSAVKLHLDPLVAGKILSSNILPKDVLDKINKPCMQVVLWKSPADKLREVVSENMHKGRRKGDVLKDSSGSRSVMAQSQSTLTCSSSVHTPITSTAIPMSRQPIIVRTVDDVDCDTAMEL